MRFANLLCVVLANNRWLFELANSVLEVCGEKIGKKTLSRAVGVGATRL